MNQLMMRLLAMTTLVSACIAPEQEAVVSTTSAELGADTTIIYNFHGDERYVKSNSNEVKLFMTREAEMLNNPKKGFRNSNDFDNSCGPTAAMNVFKWYGIVELEGQACFWHTEPERPSVPPIWVCTNRVTPVQLGNAMKTNTWSIATIGPIPGTSTGNFRSVFKPYLDKYKPADDVYQYKYDGDDLSQYLELWATLEQGHPIVVNYKTAATKGHFAVIVGLEKAGDPNSIDDDRVIMANPRLEDLNSAISYGTFRALWRRDYFDFGTLAAIGERRYTRIHLWDTTQPPPGGSGGGGGTNDGPPTHQN